MSFFTLVILIWLLGVATPLSVLSVRRIARARKSMKCAWCTNRLPRGLTNAVCDSCLMQVTHEGAAAPDGWPKA